jgi:hypothetical protein
LNDVLGFFDENLYDFFDVIAAEIAEKVKTTKGYFQHTR